MFNRYNVDPSTSRLSVCCVDTIKQVSLLAIQSDVLSYIWMDL